MATCVHTSVESSFPVRRTPGGSRHLVAGPPCQGGTFPIFFIFLFCPPHIQEFGFRGEEKCRSPKWHCWSNASASRGDLLITRDEIRSGGMNRRYTSSLPVDICCDYHLYITRPAYKQLRACQDRHPGPVTPKPPSLDPQYGLRHTLHLGGTQSGRPAWLDYCPIPRFALLFLAKPVLFKSASRLYTLRFLTPSEQLQPTHVPAVPG